MILPVETGCFDKYLLAKQEVNVSNNFFQPIFEAPQSHFSLVDENGVIRKNYQKLQ